MKDEKILVVERKKLDSILSLSGHDNFSIDKEAVFNFALNNHLYIDRSSAEHNPRYKQIIPYIAITYKNNFLLIKRTSSQTESRLHDKYSLGFGGHINPPASKKYENVIIEGLYKELNEEVYIDGIQEIELVGIINDDMSDVGYYHLGLFYLIKSINDKFEIKEKHKMSAEWATFYEIELYFQHMESWSQIVYNKFFQNCRIESKNNENICSSNC